MVKIFGLFDENGHCVDRIFLTDELAKKWNIPENHELREIVDKQIDNKNIVYFSTIQAKKRIDFFYEVLLKLSAENIALNFTREQSLEMIQLLIPVKEMLELGMVGAALENLQQIQTCAAYTEDRKAAHVAMFQEFLSSLDNPQPL